MDSMVEFKDFSVHYIVKKEKVQVLENVSFQVGEGEFFVITGPSGCGKTTMIKSMLGMGGYYSGDIFIDGVNFEDITGKDNFFGYVSQEYLLYPTMTVYDNIALPLRSMRTPHEELDRRVRALAKRLGIDWLLTRKPKQLSGGQQQLVAFARAIVRSPKVLLMDEPFSNLDPKIRPRLRQMLKEVIREYGTTVMLVTHDIPEALQLGDRIMVMDNDGITGIVTPEEFVFRHGRKDYQNFFGDL